MIIKQVLTALETAVSPVIKVLGQNEHFKAIVLGFKKDMILKEHQTNVPAKLVIIEGSVNYKEEGRNVILSKFEELDIPVNVTHSVEAIKDSICFLIRG